MVVTWVRNITFNSSSPDQAKNWALDVEVLNLFASGAKKKYYFLGTFCP